MTGGNGRYARDLQRGLEYEDFVSEHLWRHEGIGFFRFHSSKWQAERGENSSGLEIKFDDRMAETGNLFIETEERADALDIYKPSGICRADSWLYAIGNYDILYIFATQQLRIEGRKLVTNASQTALGYLMPREEAQGRAIKVIGFCS